jgi:hypothetical protein
VCQQYCAQNGCNYWSATGQTQFVLATITNPTWESRAYGRGTAAQLRSALQSTSVTTTTRSFEQLWERCGACDTSNRIKYANQWLSTVRGLCRKP